MTVYLLQKIFPDRELEYIEGVFSTKQKALDYLKSKGESLIPKEFADKPSWIIVDYNLDEGVE